MQTFKSKGLLFILTFGQCRRLLDRHSECGGVCTSSPHSNSLLLFILEKMLQRYGSLSGTLHMIELEKDPAAHGLGISLSGNKDDSRARMSIYVAHIDPKGPASLDGRIMVGDELLEVGETSKWQD